MQNVKYCIQFESPIIIKYINTLRFSEDQLCLFITRPALIQIPVQVTIIMAQLITTARFQGCN